MKASANNHREHADNNTTLILATVKAQIDDSDIIKWLNKDSREKSELVAQMEALRKANEEHDGHLNNRIRHGGFVF